MKLVAMMGVCLCAGAASAQSFVNGGFESGDFTGWTLTPTANGATAVQVVESVDIDGPGALSPSLAAKFSVGNAVSPNLPFEGIQLTQALALTGGTPYTIGFDWAAIRTITTTNSEGGRFALIVNGVELAVQAAGSTSSTLPKYGQVSAVYTPSANENAIVGVRITRQFTIPTPAAPTLFQYVDNFVIDGGVCYPDCNNSNSLTVADFACFQAAFAANDPYADCNNSGSLTIADFACFQAAFAAGCP